MGNMTYNRVLFNKDEYSTEEWMAFSGRLIHLTSSRKTLANIAETKETLQQMYWVRALYEELAEDFLRITEDYDKICVEEAILCTSLRASFGAKLGSLRLGKDVIERATGLDQTRLYGTVKAVQYHFDKYLELRNSIIQPYLRLVFAESSKLSGNSRSIAEDVFQAGVFGLIRAISTFFRERQTYFSGYARWWIRQSILLALKEEVSFFKIPSAIWHVYNKMERGEKIDENNDKIRRYVNVIKLVPIDQPVQQEPNTRLLDTIADTNHEEATEEQELRLAVLTMLERLDPVSERYLCLRFGIISHLQTRSDLSESDILKEQLRQTLALMRFHTIE
jgi:RNA polymerase sigma factor (sigma-70 family)